MSLFFLMRGALHIVFAMGRHLVLIAILLGVGVGDTVLANQTQLKKKSPTTSLGASGALLNQIMKIKNRESRKSFTEALFWLDQRFGGSAPHAHLFERMGYKVEENLKRESRGQTSILVETGESRTGSGIHYFNSDTPSIRDSSYVHKIRNTEYNPFD